MSEWNDESSEANIHVCIVKKRAKNLDYLFTDYTLLQIMYNKQKIKECKVHLILNFTNS
jgi:hypothetical protein